MKKFQSILLGATAALALAAFNPAMAGAGAGDGKGGKPPVDQSNSGDHPTPPSDPGTPPTPPTGDPTTPDQNDGTTPETHGSGRGPGAGGVFDDHSNRGGGRIEIPRLGIPPKVELPADLQALVTKYQDAAKTYATEQRDLVKQLKGATADEKAKIKDQLKANREKFLEDTAQLRADIREQVKKLRDDLKNNHEKTPGRSGAANRGRSNG